MIDGNRRNMEGSKRKLTGNWQENERHERNVNTKENALYECIFVFFQYSHINCDHHGDQGHAFRIFYLWGFGHGMQGQWKDMDMNR